MSPNLAQPNSDLNIDLVILLPLSRIVKFSDGRLKFELNVVDSFLQHRDKRLLSFDCLDSFLDKGQCPIDEWRVRVILTGVVFGEFLNTNPCMVQHHLFHSLANGPGEWIVYLQHLDHLRVR